MQNYLQSEGEIIHKGYIDSKKKIIQYKNLEYKC